MKKFIISFKCIIALSVLSFFFSACSEDTMDNINKNPNNPLDTQAKFIMAELQTSTSFSTVGGDFSFYLSSYIEHEVGVYNQMFNAETRAGEPALGSTFNNVWNGTYSNIQYAKIIIEKSSEGGSEAGNNVTLGVAKVLLAYNAALLTDLFGDVPFSEAGIMNANGTPKYMQPKVDKQEDIYKAVFTLLDEAIVLLDGKDAGPFGAMGTKDFIYEGDATKWKKAAYAMKARYTLRLLERSSNKEADLQNILTYASKSFTGVEDEFKFAQYDGVSQLNPLYSFTYSREYQAASKSLVAKLVERNDPRLTQAFYDTKYNQITDVTKINPAPNGEPEQEQGYYSGAMYYLASTTPTMLLSYHELLFIKAEALCRLNRSTEAEVVVKEAITVGFANLESAINSSLKTGFVGGKVANLDATVSEKYFTESVKTMFDKNPLKETMVQKYLSFLGASGESIEAYNDYRRLNYSKDGKDFIVLLNPKNTTQFPVRLPYSSDEILANKNVKPLFTDEGNYVYKENVWWAGGTR